MMRGKEGLDDEGFAVAQRGYLVAVAKGAG